MCSERELTNKTVPFSDTEKVKLLEFRRLNPKLSTEALTNKVGLIKTAVFVWLPANFCQLKILLSGFKIFRSSIHQFHISKIVLLVFRFSRRHRQFSLSTLTTLESNLVTMCKILNEYLAEKLFLSKSKNVCTFNFCRKHLARVYPSSVLEVRSYLEIK